MDDLISRKEAINAVREEFKRLPTAAIMAMEVIKQLPSALPERLTDDDFETIRIHLNAYKEKLCNQRRWEEAEEYQRIIDRFMAFASADPKLEQNTHSERVEIDKLGVKSGKTCTDTISRQAAIDLVKDVCDAIMSGCDSHYDPETGDEVYNDILEIDAILKCNKEIRIALANLPSAEPETNYSESPNGWIPCSERLPEWYWIEIGGAENVWDGERVIVCGKITEWPYTGMACGLYGPNGWLIEDEAFSIDDEPIAWMTLPEPYRED